MKELTYAVTRPHSAPTSLTAHQGDLSVLTSLPVSCLLTYHFGRESSGWYVIYWTSASCQVMRGVNSLTRGGIAQLYGWARKNIRTWKTMVSSLTVSLPQALAGCSESLRAEVTLKSKRVLVVYQREAGQSGWPGRWGLAFMGLTALRNLFMSTHTIRHQLANPSD